MEPTKKFLNIAIGISFILLSAAALIFTVKDHKAYAAPDKTADGYIVAGINYLSNASTAIIGYNPETNDIKILAAESPRELKK